MSNQKSNQPSLASLMARFVQSHAPESLATDFEPYEQSASFATEATAAWAETLSVAKLFGITERAPAMPSEWAAIVRGAKPVAATPFAIGSFPQLVSDWSLVVGKLPSELPKIVSEATCDQYLTKAAKSTNWYEQTVAAGIARVLGELDRAKTLLNSALTLATTDAAKQLIQHEQAVLLWVHGEKASAFEKLSQLQSNPVVEFNRGLLALQLGNAAVARTAFKQTSSDLNDRMAWKFLADLYAVTIE
jgi:hypothetical protein